MSALDRSATEIYGLIKQAPEENRLDIVRQHLDNPVVAQLLDLPQFLSWFISRDRSTLLKEVLSKHPMPSATWLAGAMYSSVDSSLLGTLVVNQLRHMDGSSLEHFIEAFVRDGAGQVSRNTMWATEEDYERDYPLTQSFSNYSPWLAVGDHFREVLDRCAQRWPKAFFLESTDETLNPDGAMTPYERMNSLRPESNGPSRLNRPEPFLCQRDASAVLEQAAKQLTSLEELSMTALSQLDSWTRSHVAYKCLEGSLPFLVMTALKDCEVWLNFERLYNCLPTNRETDRYKALEQIKQIDSVLVNFGHYASTNTRAEIISYVAKAMNHFGLIMAVLVLEESDRYGRQIVALTYRGDSWKRVRYVRASPTSAGNPRILVLKRGDRTPDGALVVIDLQTQDIPAGRSPIFFTPNYVMKTQSRPNRGYAA